MERGTAINRRESLLSSGCGVLALSLLPRPASAGWESVAEILARIRTPVFAARDFDITRYGAAGDGVKDSTEAFVRAIDACSRAGRIYRKRIHA